MTSSEATGVPAACVTVVLPAMVVEFCITQFVPLKVTKPKSEQKVQVPGGNPTVGIVAIRFASVPV